MAIMNRCCCCDVRSGSMVVAIWTMISTACSLIANVRGWANMSNAQLNDSSLIAYYVIMTLIQAALLLSACILFFGTIKYKKMLLFPYIVGQGVFLVVEAIFIIIVIVLVANGNAYQFNFLGISVTFDTLDPSGPGADLIEAYRIAYGIVAASLAVDLLLGFLCFFCVVSFYQQLRDGCFYEHVPSINQDCQPIVSSCPGQKQAYYTS